MQTANGDSHEHHPLEGQSRKSDQPADDARTGERQARQSIGTSIRRVLRNSGWSAFAQLTEKVLRFVSIPLLLSAYGRENFGLIAVVIAIRSYLGMLALGTQSGVVRFSAQWLKKGDTASLLRCGQSVFSFYAIVGVVNAGLFVGLGLWGVDLFQVLTEQRLWLRNMFFASAAYVILFWPTQLFTQILTGAEEIHYVQKCSSVRALLEFAWVLCVVQWELRIDLFFGVRLAIALTVVPAIAHRVSRFVATMGMLRFTWDWRDFRPVLMYGASMLAIGVAHTSFVELRQVILGARGVGFSSVTDFAVLSALIGVVTMMGTWVMTPLIPSVAGAMADGHDGYVDFVIFRGTKFLWCLVTMPLAWLMACASQVLSLYAGTEFERLAPWLALMAISAVDTYLSPIGGVIFASGRLKPFVIANVVFGVIGLLIVWALAPGWGVKGAVIATVAYYVCQFLYHHVYYLPRVMRVNSWSLFVSAFVRPSVAAAGTAGALLVVGRWLRFDSPAISVFLSMTVALLVHVPLVWLLAMDASDRALIGRLIRQWTGSGKAPRGKSTMMTSELTSDSTASEGRV